MREFMHGRKGNLSQQEQTVIKQVSEYNPFEKFSRQKCRDLFMVMAYQDDYLSWSDLPLSDLEYDLGPASTFTDHGGCCYFSPFYSFSKINRSKSDWPMVFHDSSRWMNKAKNGESNGLGILLNAEQFNYAFYKYGSGFKLALHDHRQEQINYRTSVDHKKFYCLPIEQFSKLRI